MAEALRHGSTLDDTSQRWRRLLMRDEMSIVQWDVAVRTGTVGMVFLLAWLLAKYRCEAALPVTLFSPLGFWLAEFVLHNTSFISLTSTDCRARC